MEVVTAITNMMSLCVSCLAIGLTTPGVTNMIFCSHLCLLKVQQHIAIQCRHLQQNVKLTAHALGGYGIEISIV